MIEVVSIFVFFLLAFASGWQAKGLAIQLQRRSAAKGHRAKPPDEEPQTVLVKRVRSSFRNPAQTRSTSYDQYKTSKGLYAPVKPGKGNTADDIEISGRDRG